MKLTAKKCEAATREKDGGKLADGGGLYLEPHKNGSKYWRYKYRILGVEKLLALGVYANSLLIYRTIRTTNFHLQTFTKVQKTVINQ